jgi:acetyl esterase/lipase
VSEDTAAVSNDATVHVPSFDLSFSIFASPESREAFVAERAAAATAEPMAMREDDERIPADLAAARQLMDGEFAGELVAKQLKRFPGEVAIEPIDVDGVYAEVFTPTAGVAEEHRDRLLINVHGGGFMFGARVAGQGESIPICATGRFKIVSVDYRQGPEHRFPAATEDLATVYEHYLGEYDPGCIGIYGTSAGGMLSAQAVPWFLEHGLPLPGALGMFAATGQSGIKGDSSALAYHVFGSSPYEPDGELDVVPYFDGADLQSAAVSPILYPELLAKFPPSLLITGTRAYEMSSVIDAHNKLTLAGARSRLHVWDGLPHGFYCNGDLPEAREVERIVVDFFAETLGGSGAPR